MISCPHIQEIAEVLACHVQKTSPHHVGRIECGDLLFGILRDEAWTLNRFVAALGDTERTSADTILGWPFVPDHNRKPMEWAIVPA